MSHRSHNHPHIYFQALTFILQQPPEPMFVKPFPCQARLIAFETLPSSAQGFMKFVRVTSESVGLFLTGVTWVVAYSREPHQPTPASLLTPSQPAMQACRTNVKGFSRNIHPPVVGGRHTNLTSNWPQRFDGCFQRFNASS